MITRDHVAISALVEFLIADGSGIEDDRDTRGDLVEAMACEYPHRAIEKLQALGWWVYEESFFTPFLNAVGYLDSTVDSLSAEAVEYVNAGEFGFAMKILAVLKRHKERP